MELDWKRPCLPALQPNDGGDRAIGDGHGYDSQPWLAACSLAIVGRPVAAPGACSEQPAPAREGQALADPDGERPWHCDHGVPVEAQDARLLPDWPAGYGKRRPV